MHGGNEKCTKIREESVGSTKGYWIESHSVKPNSTANVGAYVVHCDMTLFTKSLTLFLVTSVTVHSPEAPHLVLLVLQTCVVSSFTKWR